jgi:hypothetical protein
MCSPPGSFVGAEQGASLRSADYWVAYEKCDQKGSEIVLRNVTSELRKGTGDR